MSNMIAFIGIMDWLGALAQLGAHHTGSVGVTGSSPVYSTRKNKRCIHFNMNAPLLIHNLNDDQNLISFMPYLS